MKQIITNIASCVVLITLSFNKPAFIWIIFCLPPIFLQTNIHQQ